MQLVRPAALFLAATLFVAVAAVGCDRGSGTTTSPTPSVGSGTPAPSPTATPPPADPTLAAELRYRGDFEAAADVYAAVAADTDGDKRLAALFARGQMLLRAGDAASARIVLETQVREAAVDAEGSTAQFLLASTLDDLGEDAAALDLYSRYALAGGVLISYANIERAKLLASTARVDEAEALARSLLPDRSPAPGVGVASFEMAMGRSFAVAGLDALAIDWFGRARTDGRLMPASYAATGDARKRLGDPTWSDDYTAAVKLAPGSSDAAVMLDELDAAAILVEPYIRGLVEYRAGRNDAARLSFEAAVTANDAPGEALYYLGALDERAEDDATAIIHYQQSFDVAPESTLADSALWWRGRLLENAGRFDEAIASYETLASTHFYSEWKDGAKFHSALCLYKQGRLLEAADAWGALANAEGSEGFRARFWQGKALDEAGDARSATILRELRNDPDAVDDYYAIRAAELIGDDIDRGDRKLQPPTPDWDAIAAAVDARVTTGTPPSGATPIPTPTPVDLDADPRWRVAADLDAVGLHALSGTLRGGIIGDGAADARLMLAVTRRFFERGDESYAARAAATLLALVDESQIYTDGYLDLSRIAYPPAFNDLVTDAAGGEDLDPLLFLGLMRQESLYDPEAGSTAGALGLTQIIAPTGQSIADELGVVDFATIDLVRPSVNLRFGAHYLAAQLEAFDGNVAKALAAYNGGPGAAIDAEALAGDDPDLFVEDLEFEETRLYVRRVLEHYARYRALYGD